MQYMQPINATLHVTMQPMQNNATNKSNCWGYKYKSLVIQFLVFNVMSFPLTIWSSTFSKKTNDQPAYKMKTSNSAPVLNSEMMLGQKQVQPQIIKKSQLDLRSIVLIIKSEKNITICNLITPDYQSISKAARQQTH